MTQFEWIDSKLWNWISWLKATLINILAPDQLKLKFIAISIHSTRNERRNFASNTLTTIVRRALWLTLRSIISKGQLAKVFRISNQRILMTKFNIRNAISSTVSLTMAANGENRRHYNASWLQWMIDDYIFQVYRWKLTTDLINKDTLLNTSLGVW